MSFVCLSFSAHISSLHYCVHLLVFQLKSLALITPILIKAQAKQHGAPVEQGYACNQVIKSN